MQWVIYHLEEEQLKAIQQQSLPHKKVDNVKSQSSIQLPDRQIFD